MSKLGPRTTTHEAATTIGGTEDLVSLRLQQAATFMDDGEEDLESLHVKKHAAEVGARTSSLSS